MTPRRYGPLAYVPITRRPKLTWPGGARVALWVNPNIEFFGLDDVMPGNLNERVPREHAKIPNVRNWAVRDYGNRVGIWRIMEVLTRYGIRASAALNSEVCDHHPEIIEEAGRLGWELIGHNQTNALRLTEMDGGGARCGAGDDRPHRGGVRQAAGRLARRRAGRNLEHARLPRRSRHPLRLRLGQRRPALPVRDRQPAAGVAALFGADQRRARLFRDEGVGARIRGDAAAPVRHALPRGRNDPARHGDRGPPVCHRPAASDRRSRRRARIHLLACRRVARHRLGDRAAFPGAAIE